MSSTPTEKLSFDGLVFQFLKVELADHILTLTLARPDKKNAIHPVMASELIYAFEAAGLDPDIRVVLLRAEGDVFCAGADLAAMSGKGEPITSTVPKRGELHEINLRMTGCHKPVITLAQGDVLAGALMLVGNSTHVLAADHVTFSAPEIKRGLWPHMVMASLFRVMPKRAALDFILRGYKMTAAEATRLGLINEAVPAAELAQRGQALAQEIAALCPTSIRLGLEAFQQQDHMAFDEAIPYLFDMLQKTINTEDAKEGIMAFFQKRPPVWKGK